MKIFKRIQVSCAAGFNRLLDHVENYEAVANESIRSAKSAYAKGQVRLNRVQNDTQKLKARVAEASKQADAWRTRALKAKDANREKAIECLSRRKQAEGDLKKNEDLLKEQERVEAELQSKLKTMRARIDELERKRNLLTVRDQGAKAAEAMADCATSDEIFERWEEQVLECELSSPEYSESDTDSFTREIQTEEDRAALEAELDELNEKPE